MIQTVITVDFYTASIIKADLPSGKVGFYYFCRLVPVMLRFVGTIFGDIQIVGLFIG